jgi:hypothetical protein
VLGLAGSSAFAQQPPAPAPKPEPKPEVKTEGEQPVIHVPLPGDSEDAHQKMIKLFGEVEKSLAQIDKLLSEAAAGQRGAQDAQKPLEKAVSGINELMKQTQDQGKAVVEGIEKILELAQQQQQQGEGQGSGQGQGQSGGKSQKSQDGQQGQQGDQQGKDPLAGQRDTTTQRESTPDKPGSEKGKQPEGGSQPDQGGTPKGNKKSNNDPKNTNGKTPPGSATEKNAHAPDSRDSWGYLPEHARDVFRTQGGGQMPARYREWIDAYYKKLNQKP